MDTGRLLASQSKPNGELQVKQEILLKKKKQVESKRKTSDIDIHACTCMCTHMQTLRDIESLL